MKKVILLSLVLLSSILGCWSQNRMPHGPRGNRHGHRTERQMHRRSIDPELKILAQEFQSDSINVGENEFYYSLKKFDGNNVDAPIVFLYLHGGGGRDGNDNSHVQHPAIKNLTEYISENNINALIVAPRCPKGTVWEKIGTNITTLLDTVITRNNADKSRIYLLGTSFGAQGGWGILSQYPDLFAAAQLASAAPKRYTLENVIKTPIYFSLGENDIDKASSYESDIKKIQEAGGEIVFTILPGLNHQQACDAAYTSETVNWLLKHKKN
ncbi:MAG: hypothetical protein K2J12_03405 [Muribaculaceae bacterium]|nr:hypothetical protein [Muribaculaceae bacterium]